VDVVFEPLHNEKHLLKKISEGDSVAFKHLFNRYYGLIYSAYLPPQQQTAYKLSRDEGLSYLEIAERMKLSVNTIKVHISQALKTLKIFFAQHKEEYLLWLFVLSMPATQLFTQSLILFLN
jgi:hypothetical protein